MPEPTLGLENPNKTLPLENLIACVEREIKYRRRVYPRLINSLRMKPKMAEYEITCMVDVLLVLQDEKKRRDKKRRD